MDRMKPLIVPPYLPSSTLYTVTIDQGVESRDERGLHLQTAGSHQGALWCICMQHVLILRERAAELLE